MSGTMVVDPRTEIVDRAADSLDHIFCGDCWEPGMPMLCGSPDDPTSEICPDESCGHPTCSMCEYEWEIHWDRFHADGDEQ